jgi:hypothetical protein
MILKPTVSRVQLFLTQTSGHHIYTPFFRGRASKKLLHGGRIIFSEGGGMLSKGSNDGQGFSSDLQEGRFHDWPSFKSRQSGLLDDSSVPHEGHRVERRCSSTQK